MFKSNSALEMGRELNREIIEELKQIEEENPEVARDLKKELNKDRIKALGLTLIRGGKYEEQ